MWLNHQNALAHLILWGTIISQFQYYCKRSQKAKYVPFLQRDTIMVNYKMKWTIKRHFTFSGWQIELFKSATCLAIWCPKSCFVDIHIKCCIKITIWFLHQQPSKMPKGKMRKVLSYFCVRITFWFALLRMKKNSHLLKIWLVEMVVDFIHIEIFMYW